VFLCAQWTWPRQLDPGIQHLVTEFIQLDASIVNNSKICAFEYLAGFGADKTEFHRGAYRLQSTLPNLIDSAERLDQVAQYLRRQLFNDSRCFLRQCGSSVAGQLERFDPTLHFRAYVYEIHLSFTVEPEQ
jgi:hypothetical protein